MSVPSKEMIFYVSFPLSVFILHFLYLKFVSFVSRKKIWVILTNVLLYPIEACSLVSGFLWWYLNTNFKAFLSSVIMGIVAYYGSILMTFLPFIGIIFGELDLEFLVLAIGSIIGISHPLLASGGLKRMSGINIIPILVVFVVAFIMSVLIKQVATSSLKTASYSNKDALSVLVLSLCISTGMISVLLAILVTHIKLI